MIDCFECTSMFSSRTQSACDLKLQTHRNSKVTFQCCCCGFFSYFIRIINNCWYMQMQDRSIPEMCYSPRPLSAINIILWGWQILVQPSSRHRLYFTYAQRNWSSTTKLYNFIYFKAFRLNNINFIFRNRTNLM